MKRDKIIEIIELLGNSNHSIAKALLATFFTLLLISAVSSTVAAAGNCDDAAIRCNDNNACTTDTCDTATGACGHTAIVCNDNNNCTVDTCNPATGCVFTAKNCDDNNICTTDSCVSIIPGGCVHAPNTLPCNDNNACTVNDTCKNAVCTGTAKNCNDNDACTIDSCDTASGNCVRTLSPTPGCQSCIGQPDGTDCTDLNACTMGDKCLDNVCVPGPARTCNDNNACTADICSTANGCVYTIDDTLPCTDKNSCTDGDHCLNGVCKSGVLRSCDDSNPCTDDKYVPIIAQCCVHVPNTKACNDNNACTLNDVCANSICKGTQKTCDDSNACTTDTCDTASGNCIFSPVPEPCYSCIGRAGSVCSDNNACTINDVCVNQVCVGTPRTCNDNNVCTTDTCNTVTGCVFTNNTVACSDNNYCTSGDVCLNGVCKPGATMSCDDGNICTIDTSVPFLPGCCVHGANTLACNDNNACTIGDVCANKICKGTPVADGTVCNDNNVCTENDACSGGVCVAGVPKVCPVGVCDAASGCPIAYTITASADSNGTISPSGVVSVISGATTTFTMTPNMGYHVADVLVDGLSQAAITSYSFTNLTANHTITASFAADDTIPPTGSIVINNGAAFTNTTTVTLTLSATDSGSGVSQMQFSNDGSTWSTPEAYATSKSWPLTTDDGTKTVYANFKDNAGNWMTEPCSGSITLDTTPPVVVITAPTAGNTNIRTPTVTYTVSDGTVVVKVDGVAVNKVSGNNLDILSFATHTVRVESTDAANNIGYAEVSFTVVDPALVGQWHMDGDWTDASGNGNNGIASGATFSTNARVGSQAGSFDGLNDYVKVKSSAIIANSPQSTIQAWVNPASLAASQTIYSENISGGVVFILTINPSGSVSFGIWRTDVPGNWAFLTSDAALQINTWSHIAATLDSTGMKIYINGALFAADATHTRPSNVSVVETWLGRVNIGGGAAYLSGLVDEVAIYNRALTAAEINGSYNAGLGRVALWHMDGDWTDAQGNGNNGTISVNSAFSTDARIGSESGNFDGVASSVTGTVSRLPLGNVPRTVSAWVKPAGGTQNRGIIQYGADHEGYFHLMIDSSNRAVVGSDSGVVIGVTSLADGRWHYVVGIYEGSDTNVARIYVDGVLENTGSITAPGTVNGNFAIGSFLGGGGYYNGLIDELAVYNCTLTLDEINKSYDDGLGRIGLWHMDGDWTDSSGHNNGVPYNYNGDAFSENRRVGTQSGDFNGTNQFIKVGASALIANLPQSTFAAWVYPLAFGGSIYAENTSTGATFLIYTQSTGTVGIGIWRSDVSGNWIWVNSNAVISTNNWSHVAVTLDSTGIKIYINGVLAGTNTNASPSNATVVEADIGRVLNGGGSMYFNGLLDEVVLYNRALSAQEIIDTAGVPYIQITSPAGSTNNNTPLLNYTVINGAVTAVKINGNAISKVSGDNLDIPSDGTYTLRVEAVNRLGDIGFAEKTFTVDTVPPTVSVNPVASPTNATTQTITGNVETGAVVTVSVDTSATPGVVTYPTATTWSCRVTNLVSGSNNIAVTAADAAGNSTTANASIVQEIITISNVTVDPTGFDLSYGQVMTIKYSLSQSANVTVTLQLAPALPVTLASGPQPSGANEILYWNGLDSTDPNNKKFVISQEGYYTLKISADNAVSHAEAIAYVLIRR